MKEKKNRVGEQRILGGFSGLVFSKGGKCVIIHKENKMNLNWR